MSKKIRVGVVFGGRSGEHDVSLRSARSVMEAMDREAYKVVPIGITRQGEWLGGGDPMRVLEAGAGGDPDETAMLPPASLLRGLDVVFPVLHGPFGEDGTVQGLLELAGVPYVGAGVTASAVSMDKVIFKDVIRSHGLPMVAHRHATLERWEAEPEAVLDEIETALGYPVFTKPANLGSSVGISRCLDRKQLREGLQEAARYDRKLLVEAAVPDAREIEVSVLGNEEPVASVPGEIEPSRDFYDYAAKYLDDGAEASRLLIPAPLPEELTSRVRGLAIQTYRAVDCAGMARVDFLLGGDALYVNEVNTIPGFTAISMYSKLWEATGIRYADLVSSLIHLALERHASRQSLSSTYRSGTE